MGCCVQSTYTNLGAIANLAKGVSQDKDTFDSSIIHAQAVMDADTVALIHTLLQHIKSDPLTFPSNINSSLLWDIGVRIGKSTMVNDAKTTELLALIHGHFDEQLTTKNIALHSAYIYMLSEISFRSNKDEYGAYCQRVFDDAKALVSNVDISGAQRKYVKSILTFNLKGNSWHFVELKKTAENILNGLCQPLLVAYQQLEDANDAVLRIAMEDEYCFRQGKFQLEPNFIRKEINGISDDIRSWYGKGFMVEHKHEALVVQQFNKLGFESNQVDGWLHAMRNAESKLEPSSVLREMLWRMADRVNDQFQQLMQKCFEENHRQYTTDENKNDEADMIGHRGCAVKTKSRVWTKVYRDYAEKYNFSLDAYFCVMDWVRCSVIVRTPKELQSLYALICSEKYFGGKILRVKNGLAPTAEAEFGYRVLMINAAYRNVIVEIQCMLLPFMKVKKKMHVLYKIMRASKTNDLAQDMGTTNG